MDKLNTYKNENNKNMNTKKTINEAEDNAVLPLVMPRISHFLNENGNTVDINVDDVNVRLTRDGTHEYWRDYGFAGVMKLTPVYRVGF